MKHIFYLHSNICVISSYDTIIKLVEKGENVVVVSERHTRFPRFNEIIVTYDIEDIIDRYRKSSSNVFSQTINYRCDLIPNYKRFAADVIREEPFMLYIPSYSMFTILPFLHSKYCLGYYFIEEGALSYLSAKSLRKRYLKRRYMKGRFLLDLIGAGETPDYKITRNFKGCIALSNEAFPWCVDKRILTGFNGYYSNIVQDDVDIEHLIITDYLRSNKSIIIAAFKKIIDSVIKPGFTPRIGIKFHPTAYAYEGKKIDIIMSELEVLYPDINLILLPAPFSVEKLMYQRHLSLYSVFNSSSLLLYSIMLKSRSYMLTFCGEQISVTSIPTINDFIRLTNQI